MKQIYKTISFVIPVYNEEKRIYKTIKALKELRLPRGLKLEEIIFVNDGSKDRSEARIKSSEIRIKNKLKAKVTLISYKPNRGKGYAVRAGLLASNSEYTLLFDADMSTPLTELSKFVPYIQDGTDVLIGTRKNGHSTVIVHQPFYRELLGRGFTLLSNVALNTWVTDFTCGFKLFSKDAKDAIFAKAVIDKWGFDAETLFLARKLGFTIQERAVAWSDDRDSKVVIWKAVPQSIVDLLTIRFVHSVKPVLTLSMFPGMNFKREASV